MDEKLGKLIHNHKYHWIINSAFRYFEIGVLVASVLEPLGSCGLRHKEPLISLPKTSLVSLYRIFSVHETLMVANIHGINFSSGTGAYLKQLRELGTILLQHDGPLILAGDFNNWSNDRAIILNQLTQDPSLQVLVFNEENRTTFLGVPVDHIFYRCLQPVKHAVLPVTSSDHNPISVTFRFVKTH